MNILFFIEGLDYDCQHNIGSVIFFFFDLIDLYFYSFCRRRHSRPLLKSVIVSDGIIYRMFLVFCRSEYAIMLPTCHLVFLRKHLGKHTFVRLLLNILKLEFSHTA